jgi:hypothetical protein
MIDNPFPISINSESQVAYNQISYGKSNQDHYPKKPAFFRSVAGAESVISFIVCHNSQLNHDDKVLLLKWCMPDTAVQQKIVGSSDVKVSF